MDESIRPAGSEAPSEVRSWRTYDEQRRQEIEEVERLQERPVEEGKGQYVDVLA